MSSGYCSLEEELEDCFFTAKTTFFRSVQSKRPSKVNRASEMQFLPWWGCEVACLASRLGSKQRPGDPLEFVVE